MAKLSTISIILMFEFFVFLSAHQSTSQEMNHFEAEVKLKQHLFEKYDKHTLPPHVSSPVVVSFGLTIIALQNVDPKRQTVEIEAWQVMTWQDNRLAWDNSTYNLTAIRVPSDKVWIPDIRLYNSDISTTQDRKHEVFCLLFDKGEVIWIPPVSLVAHCRLDLKHYPYDVHECQFKFGSWTYDGTHISIELNNGLEKADLSELWNEGSEWELVGSRAKVNSKKYDCCEENYYDVQFNVTIRRRSPFYKAAILCPLTADIFLILLSFWICPLSYERITLNVVAFLSLNLIVQHLTWKLPATGNSPPLIMIFCGMLIVLSVVLMGLNVWFMSIIKSKNNQPPSRWISVLLQSWIAKILCVNAPKSFERFSNDEALTSPLDDHDEIRKPVAPTISNQARNPWLYFFQMVDRTAFAVSVIVLTSFIITASV